MSQFKRFNASENKNYNTGDAYESGTLTWDPNNGLRLHDGGTSGGNQIGIADYYQLSNLPTLFSGSYTELSNKPTGLSAVLDLIGGSSAEDDGKFLQQQYTPQAGRYTAWTRSVVVVDAPAHNNSLGVVGQIAFDDNYIYRCTQTNVAEVLYVYDAPFGRNTSPYDWTNQADPTSLRLFSRSDSVAPQVGWKTYDGTNLRTITNVFTQNSGFGTIHDLTLDSPVDYSTATTITVYQTQPADALWKRTPLNADTW